MNRIRESAQQEHVQLYIILGMLCLRSTIFEVTGLSSTVGGCWTVTGGFPLVSYRATDAGASALKPRKASRATMTQQREKVTQILRFSDLVGQP